MFRKILAVLVVIVAGVLLLAASKPDRFEIQRSISIKAPPQKVFDLVADFKSFALWSPWERLDPAMKKNLSPTTGGKGAFYEWDGNDKVGKGRMEITEASPPGKVLMDLHFMKPFEARNVAEFTFAPRGDATEATWKMSGPSPFISKLMQVFISMDRMVGPDFEAGLVNLKSLAEK